MAGHEYTPSWPIPEFGEAKFERSLRIGWPVTSTHPPGASPNLAKPNLREVCASDGRSRVHTLLAHPMREFVGCYDQSSADDAFDQARGRGDTPLTTDDALEVHVRVQDLTRRRTDRVALEQNLLESDRQDQAEPQDKQQHGDPQNAWQCNAPQPLPASGAIDDRGLIQS